MKAGNTLVQREQKTFSEVIQGDKAQALIKAALKDDKAVGRFTGTLISIVNASQQLRECKPGSIIAAALRGEGAGLIYGQGYYVVPYGKDAGYITSYKGWCQLAIATGLYADIDVVEVREGERKGRDKRTGKPIIDMSVYETDEERYQHPVIGVKAYFELKDGYYREEYWSMPEILRHADRYSPAFSLELYERWQNGGQLTNKEIWTVENGTPWYRSTEKMAKKTVLKSLLTSGFAPLSNEVKSMLDAENESGDAVIPDFGDDLVGEYPTVETTGEVIDAPFEAVEAPQSEFEGETGNNAAAAEKTQDAPKTSRRAKNKPVDAEMDVAEADALGGFFD